MSADVLDSWPVTPAAWLYAQWRPGPWPYPAQWPGHVHSALIRDWQTLVASASGEAGAAARVVAQLQARGVNLQESQPDQLQPAAWLALQDAVLEHGFAADAAAFAAALRALFAERTPRLARLALRADHSLFVSAEEASLFAERLDPPQRAAASIRVLRNGIDCAWFDPAAVRPEPQMAGLPEPRLIFTGQMDYPPNIAAAERAFRLMPAIRAQLPGASLHIVGRNPPRRLRQHHGCNGCYVWGEVPDIRPCWPLPTLRWCRWRWPGGCRTRCWKPWPWPCRSC